MNPLPAATASASQDLFGGRTSSLGVSTPSDMLDDSALSDSSPRLQRGHAVVVVHLSHTDHEDEDTPEDPILE